MKQTVLVLGPTGRFGRNAALAFENAGWQVRRFDRKRDTLESAAHSVDVIVQAWNPPYHKWSAQVAAMQPSVHRVALANDATVIIPGNVYIFGEQTPAPWSHTSQYAARNTLGKIRIAMEQSYKDAGVRTIVLRAGDYLDTEASGNWFDKIMAPGLRKGVLTYPGTPDIDHAWGFLPDVARAAVALAEMRETLDRFTDVCYKGYTLSGEQLAATIATARDHDVHLKLMHRWPLQLLRPFMPDIKHIIEMEYLWHTPHSLDPTLFNELVPDFSTTPAVDALRKASAFVPMPKGARLSPMVA